MGGMRGSVGWLDDEGRKSGDMAPSSCCVFAVLRNEPCSSVVGV